MVEQEADELRELIGKLQSRDTACRLAVARCLQEVGAPAVPLLLAALEEAEPAVREAILATLGLIGPAAREAISTLERIAEEDETLSEAAARALSQIRYRRSFDGKRFLIVGLAWLGFLLALAAVASDLGAWAGLFAQAEGAARSIALVWAFLGAVVGMLFCVHGGADRSTTGKTVRYVSVAGAFAGAFLGRWVGTIVDALIRSLAGAG
jgi:hypothetical protein